MPSRCCRGRGRAGPERTSAATAATWCCASCARTCSGFWQSLDRHAGGDAGARQRLAERWWGARCTACRWSAERRDRGRRGAGDPALNAFTYRDPTRRACAARSARTSGAAIRATPTCPPGSPGVCRVAIAHARLRRAALDRGPGGLDALPPPAAARPRVRRRGAAAAGPARGRRGQRNRGCTSSAWAPTSRASSSSCRAPGWWARDSTGCRRERSAARQSPAGQADGATRRLLDAAARRPGRASSRLPQFVTVLGGAYFFLPGIRALRFLAGSPLHEEPADELEPRSPGSRRATPARLL